MEEIVPSKAIKNPCPAEGVVPEVHKWEGKKMVPWAENGGDGVKKDEEKEKEMEAIKGLMGDDIGAALERLVRPMVEAHGAAGSIKLHLSACGDRGEHSTASLSLLCGRSTHSLLDGRSTQKAPWATIFLDVRGEEIVLTGVIVNDEGVVIRVGRVWSVEDAAVAHSMARRIRSLAALQTTGSITVNRAAHNLALMGFQPASIPALARIVATPSLMGPVRAPPGLTDQFNLEETEPPRVVPPTVEVQKGGEEGERRGEEEGDEGREEEGDLEREEEVEETGARDGDEEREGEGEDLREIDEKEEEGGDGEKEEEGRGGDELREVEMEEEEQREDGRRDGEKEEGEEEGDGLREKEDVEEQREEGRDGEEEEEDDEGRDEELREMEEEVEEMEGVRRYGEEGGRDGDELRVEEARDHMGGFEWMDAVSIGAVSSVHDDIVSIDEEISVSSPFRKRHGSHDCDSCPSAKRAKEEWAEIEKALNFDVRTSFEACQSAYTDRTEAEARATALETLLLSERARSSRLQAALRAAVRAPQPAPPLPPAAAAAAAAHALLAAEVANFQQEMATFLTGNHSMPNQVNGAGDGTLTTKWRSIAQVVSKRIGIVFDAIDKAAPRLTSAVVDDPSRRQQITDFLAQGRLVLAGFQTLKDKAEDFGRLVTGARRRGRKVAYSMTVHGTEYDIFRAAGHAHLAEVRKWEEQARAFP